MAVSSKTITTPSGVTLYVDDVNPQRFYFLPTGLDLAIDETGAYRFSLLFYQSDFPERGARLKMILRPKYPQLDSTDVANAVGEGVELVGLPFEGGEIQFRWPIDMATPKPVQVVINDVIDIEISLSQLQASVLRQLFKVGAESVGVFARLAYRQTTEPLPVKAHLKLKQICVALHAQAGETSLTGMRLRTSIAELPPSAIELKARDELALLPRRDMLLKCTPVLAPLIAKATADLDSTGLIFDDKIFRWRPTEQVEDAEIWLDLSRPRSWTQAWQGEWSMSEFRKQVEAAGELPRYFPEVLHVPAVGVVPVFVENLLTLTPGALEEVQVTLKHKKLGSLEEEVFDHRFLPGVGPVVQHPIPRIAFTPFEYQYKSRLLVAPASPGGPIESLPPNPQWQKTNQPVIRVGAELLPCALVFASVREGVFPSVGRVEIDFAPVEGDPPQPLARAVLTSERPSCWLLVRALPATTRQIHWRPLFYQNPNGVGTPVVGVWRSESQLQAVLDSWDVLPRKSCTVEVAVQKGYTPEIHQVTVHLRSGSELTTSMEPDLEWSFFADETRTFSLWPRSIFEKGFTYKYGLILADGSTALWTDWRVGEGKRVAVKVEDEFYRTKTIEVTMRAPWSAQHSPDLSSRAGEIIYAEVYIAGPSTIETQSRDFTFDADNKGTCFTWSLWVRTGAEHYTYAVSTMSVDGRIHEFGPYPREEAKLSLEIICKSVSSYAPPQFDLRVLNV